MANANLLVTCDPSHRATAEKNIEALLKEAKASCKFLKSSIDGLLFINAKNPKKAVNALLKKVKKETKKFTFTFHWVPIDKWCSSSLKTMISELKKLDKKIKPKEKWKMELAKRDYEMGAHELIMKLTEAIDKPNVDLDKPDKIVRIEIVGKKAGISLLNNDEILNVSNYI